MSGNPLDLNQVNGALEALYLSQDPTTKHEASNFLLNFQSSPAAWNWVNQVLSAEGNVREEFVYFAAQTLRTKIAFDFPQLEPSLHESLFLFVMELGDKCKGSSSAIQNQVCLAIADVFLQLQERCPDCIGMLMQKFATRGDMLWMLLQILSVIPEEASNPRIHIDGNLRASFKTKQITPHGPHVIDFLLQTLGADKRHQEKVFHCLTAWINLRAISLETLCQSQIFGAIFEALRSDSLFDAAVECVETMIIRSRPVESHLEATQEIVRRLDSLHDRMRSAFAEQDEDVLIGFSRIFVQMAEYYAPQIAAFPQAFQPIVEMVAQLSGLDTTSEVNKMAFSFWSLLAETLNDVTFEEKRSPFVTFYLSLMASLISRASYAQEGLYSASYLHDLASFRLDIAEILRDCCFVIGGNECLNVAFNSLSVHLSNPAGVAWTQIESVLFAIDAIAPTLDFNTSCIAPLFSGILSLSTSSPQIFHPTVRLATLRICESYSQWTRRNLDSLDLQVSYILAALSSENGQFHGEIVKASVHALASLAKACGLRLSARLDHIFPVLSSLPLTSMELRVKADETLALLVSALPPEKLVPSLGFLLQPVVEDLQRISQGREIHPQVVAFCLARLGGVLGSIKPHLYKKPFSQKERTVHPCAPIMSELWPLLDSLFVASAASSTVMEALCMCLSKYVANCKLHAEPIIQRVLAHFRTLFATSLNPCFLVAMEQCLLALADKGTHQTLVAIQEVLTSYTTTIAQGCQAGSPVHGVLQDNPEIFISYFDLLETALKEAPHLVTVPRTPQDGSLNGSIVISLVALRTNHQEVINHMAQYLTSSLTASLYGGLKATRKTMDVPVTRDRHLENIWKSHGTELMANLAVGVCSSFPMTVSWMTVASLYNMLGRYFGSDVLALGTESGITLSTGGVLQSEIDEFLENMKTNNLVSNLERSAVLFEGFAQLSRRRTGKQQAN